jgi:hypothetical protein
MTQAERIEKLERALREAYDCFNGQHNLLSTATDEERRAVVANFLEWWNGKAAPVLYPEEAIEWLKTVANARTTS